MSEITVFLDVDGVLNSPGTCKETPGLHRGVDDLRIEILAKAMANYKSADLILSSDTLIPYQV